jgi:hypothetical protein
MAWINSDDFYEIGAFFTIANEFHENPDVSWVVGECKMVDPSGNKRKGWGKPVDEFEKWFVGTPFMQPGVFWTKNLWEQTNYIDESLTYAFDYDLWFQFAIIQRFPLWINEIVAFFRVHDESKSIKNKADFIPEIQIIQKRYAYLLPGIRSKLRIIQLRQMRKSVKILNHYMNKKNPQVFWGIFKAIAISPWMVFSKGFYHQIKKNLLDKAE